jgi:hypothetical protein
MEKLLKSFIWLYVILLIFEGALRKWVMPSLSDPLLVVRDPVVMAIYGLAFVTGRFPFNGFIAATVALAISSIAASFIGGHSNLLVIAYGVRINYGHLPLIWVMAQTLTRKDIEKLGSFLLLIALPMTALMVLQFKSPMDSPINRGIGGDEGGQIYGALGRIRPPGFFSFITGPQVFYPFVAAFFLYQASAHRRLWWPVLIAAGLALIIALPVSISRTVMLATGIVGIVFALSMGRAGISLGSHFKMLITLGVVAVGVSFLPIFGEGREVFMSRWDTAAVSSDGDAWGSLTGRVIGGFIEPFKAAARAPLFGYGIGVGSNVGARLLSGRVGFLLAEDEWSKTFMELGALLGGAFIFFRVFLTLYLLMKSLHALFTDRDNLPILIWSAVAFPLALAQWAPPTLLGFSVVGSGLLLASLNPDPVEEDSSELIEEEADQESLVIENPQPVRVRY